MKKSIFILALAALAMACNNAGRQQDGKRTTEEHTTETATVSADLFGKEWKLTTLNGEAIVLDTTFNTEPHLIFDEVSSRVAGNGGCNGFGGNLELTAEGGIGISDIAATQMACPNLNLEQRFITVLTNVKSYRIEGNTLVLEGENSETAALFEQVN